MKKYIVQIKDCVVKEIMGKQLTIGDKYFAIENIGDNGWNYYPICNTLSIERVIDNGDDDIIK